MSLFSWFTRKPAPATSRDAEAPGSLNTDETVPMASTRNSKSTTAKTTASPDTSHRISDRTERRELLYMVVRDAMVRAGILSAGYKFKVLSLDQKGRQFLVMIDLTREYGGDTTRLSEIEVLIAQTAKTRYDILVTAVYWRISDHVAVAAPPKGTEGHKAARTSAHAPLTATPEPTPRPAATAPVAAPAATTPPARPPQYDPIEADEVAAFKRALAQAAARPSTPPTSQSSAHSAQKPVAKTSSVHTGPLREPLSDSGFADTELPTDPPAPQELGSTQYGALR